MEFFTSTQLVLAAIIVGVMQLLKPILPKRLRPFMPFVIGIALATLVTVIEFGGVPPWPVLVSNSIWLGIVGAVLSMAGFDVIHKGFKLGYKGAEPDVAEVNDALGGTDPED
jgi:hypothetical protein